MFLRRLYVLLGLCKILRTRGQVNQVSYRVERITNLMHHFKRELAGTPWGTSAADSPNELACTAARQRTNELAGAAAAGRTSAAGRPVRAIYLAKPAGDIFSLTAS